MSICTELDAEVPDIYIYSYFYALKIIIYDMSLTSSCLGLFCALAQNWMPRYLIFYRLHA